MPKIRKRARAFAELAAKYHDPVQWAEVDPDSDCIPWQDRGEFKTDRRNVPVWEIPNARGKDMFDQSSTYELSNHRSILRDFGEGHGLVILSWSNVDALGIRLDKVSKELLEVCEALLDYPVYDESDWSELEVELESENWDLNGRRDLISELERAGYDGADDLEDSAIDSAWWDAQNEFGIFAQFEGGEGCYWPGMADAETLEFVAGNLGLTREPAEV